MLVELELAEPARQIMEAHFEESRLTPRSFAAEIQIAEVLAAPPEYLADSTVGTSLLSCVCYESICRLEFEHADYFHVFRSFTSVLDFLIPWDHMTSLFVTELEPFRSVAYVTMPGYQLPPL